MWQPQHRSRARDSLAARTILLASVCACTVASEPDCVERTDERPGKNMSPSHGMTQMIHWGVPSDRVANCRLSFSLDGFSQIVSFAGNFRSDVRMFIALRLKQLDRDRELLPRSLLKPKKKGPTVRSPKSIFGAGGLSPRPPRAEPRTVTPPRIVSAECSRQIDSAQRV
jgi:hypothetical protein